MKRVRDATWHGIVAHFANIRTGNNIIKLVELTLRDLQSPNNHLKSRHLRNRLALQPTQTLQILRRLDHHPQINPQTQILRTELFLLSDGIS